MGMNLGKLFDSDRQQCKFVPVGAESVPAEIPVSDPMEIGAIAPLKSHATPVRAWAEQNPSTHI